MSTHHTIRTLLTELSGPQRPNVIASVISPAYIEHIDGSDATLQLEKPSAFPIGTNYQTVRTITEVNSIAVDLWQTEGETIVGRWFSRTPEVRETANGHSQLDGATEIHAAADTGASKSTVTAWMKAVLLSGDLTAVSNYVSQVSYEQHNPEVADGIDGFAAAVAKLGESGLSFDYATLDIVVAEGDFVFTRALGTLGPAVVFNDIWRLADGKIVEHWDVVSPLSPPMPSTVNAHALVA
jgi:predicted SnoaL-like aldol condensation-catalyzing enzyme